ncbi:hypothetical protein A5875_000350, partial [Enterococcus sp. 3H8_DIV0648]
FLFLILGGSMNDKLTKRRFFKMVFTDNSKS